MRMNCVKVFNCPVASLGGCFNLEEHVKYWLNLGKPTHGHNFLLLLVLDKMLIFFIDGIQTICFHWMLFDTCCCFVQEMFLWKVVSAIFLFRCVICLVLLATLPFASSGEIYFYEETFNSTGYSVVFH